MRDGPASQRQISYLAKLIGAKTKYGARLFGEQWLGAWTEETTIKYPPKGSTPFWESLSAREASALIDELVTEGWDHAMGPVRIANLLRLRKVEEVGFSYDDPYLVKLASYEKPPKPSISFDTSPATSRQLMYLADLWQAKYDCHTRPPKHLTKGKAHDLIEQLVNEGYGDLLKFRKQLDKLETMQVVG